MIFRSFHIPALVLLIGLFSTECVAELKFTHATMDSSGRAFVLITDMSETSNALHVRAYKPDGSLDTSFGQEGSTKLPAIPGDEALIGITPSNNLIVVRSDLEAPSKMFSANIVRLSPKGAIIPGPAGTTVSNVGLSPQSQRQTEGVQAFSFDSEGRLILALALSEGAALMRLQRSDQVDFSYGDRIGRAMIPVSEPSKRLAINNLVIDNLGNSLVTGYIFIPSRKHDQEDPVVSLVRVSSNGDRVEVINKKARPIIDDSRGMYHGVASAPSLDGKFLYIQKLGETGRVTIERYNSSGIKDRSFSCGDLCLPLGRGGIIEGDGLIALPDGSLLTPGRLRTHGQNFVLTRTKDTGHSSQVTVSNFFDSPPKHHTCRRLLSEIQ